jgi:hypothetical protein
MEDGFGSAVTRNPGRATLQLASKPTTTDSEGRRQASERASEQAVGSAG